MKKKMNILLTGSPGVGKTTAIKKVVEYLKSKGVPMNGFYTEEKRSEAGERIGFVIKALNGSEASLATTAPTKGPKVGKYTVNMKSIDEVAVESIKEGIKQESISTREFIG